jgi:glucose-6-phosphate 1-dehydrogenase
LHDNGDLPASATILGVGRRPWNDDEYRSRIADSIRAASGDAIASPDFLGRFYYHEMDMRDNAAYDTLRVHADELAAARGFGPNRVFFLATAPDLFPVIADNLGRTHLADGGGGFRRLMVEKPFGRDLASARSFNESLYRRFDEGEIFRIDHYLGKEMLQNILVLRFANRLFEPVWNRDHIDHVQITVRETRGVDQRGGYYENAGALRDMVQSHLLQLVALLAMEKPVCFDAECVRDEKVSVLRSLRPLDPDRIGQEAVLAQYATSGGGPGYRQEKGVDPDSGTETYSSLKLFVDNDRWRDVPFYLRTGKALDRNAADIAVVFKKEVYGLMDPFDEPDVLIFRIQPLEGVDLRFNIKKPGTVSTVTQVGMDFCQSCRFPGQSPDAYVRLIRDAWTGDPGLFTRWDEIEASWTLIDSIQDARGRIPLEEYPRDSRGPASADRLIGQDGRQWIDPDERTPGDSCGLCERP